MTQLPSNIGLGAPTTILLAQGWCCAGLENALGRPRWFEHRGHGSHLVSCL